MARCDIMCPRTYVYKYTNEILCMEQDDVEIKFNNPTSKDLTYEVSFSGAGYFRIKSPEYENETIADFSSYDMFPLEEQVVLRETLPKKQSSKYTISWDDFEVARTDTDKWPPNFSKCTVCYSFKIMVRIYVSIKYQSYLKLIICGSGQIVDEQKNGF
jgi:hypothetical protein